MDGQARVGAMLATAFGGLGTLLAAILAAGLANFVPARRAMRIGPMTALRTD